MFGIQKRQWSLVLASGLLQVLIFPSPSLYALCWVALAPLFITILGPAKSAPEFIDPQGRNIDLRTPRQGFVLGYASGMVWYLGSCYWVYHVMHLYGGLNSAVAAGILLLFALYLSLYHGVFGWLLVQAKRRSLGNALLLAPFLWVAVELARARITGFPWDLLGTSQVDNIPVTRMATWAGVYGISFLIALVNSGFAAAYYASPARRSRLLGTAFAIAVLLQLGVFVSPKPLAAPFKALLVQQNIPLDVTWTRDSLEKTTADLTQISTIPAAANSPGPRLIIWPESPAPFFDNDANFRTAISSLAHTQNASVIVTLVGVLPPGQHASPQSEPDLANRALLIAPDGSASGRYDKIHLVPFGEYVPFKSLFAFADKLTREVGNYQPGNVRSVFHVEGHGFGTFICYESIFPDEIRQFVGNGAEVLVNLSNDGWYGEHGAPGQHLNMARMRAIENQRWLLRATNTGVTASIDPLGRIVAAAPRNQRTTLNAAYDFVPETTFYTRHGDWFAWACVIISFAGIFVRFKMQAGQISR